MRIILHVYIGDGLDVHRKAAHTYLQSYTL